ncbi:MAG TPA: hypothetical protein DDZ51_00905 [Planctomycetaceae bacterium]|nr:hypothetical protein [Planctomycetaceae bacterium]
MESSCSYCRPICCIVFCLVIGGCRSAAPIYVWTPPKLAPAVGSKVAIAPIRGNSEIAQPLHDAMLRNQPRDSGRSVLAIDAQQLPSGETIRLVSAVEGDTSDIALMTLARRNDIDFVLVGEVLESSDRRHRASNPLPAMPEKLDLSVENTATDSSADKRGLIRVSWSLMDVRRGIPLSGLPVVTPGNPSQPDDEAIALAASSAWELVVPHVFRDHAELTAPRLVFGSGDIRKGNAAAAAGDWNTAEQIWRAILQRHPRNHAAKHNLAVAAVARQDYSAARRFIAEALAARSTQLYRSTAVWIEQSQRDYHTAFGLPDPPEGWAATSR